jgi:C1A family cysteine protease
MSLRKKIAGKTRHMWGWVRDLPDHRDWKYVPPPKFVRTLPPKVDLRLTCAKIENQADLGSCTANASTSAMEFLYNVFKKPMVDFSRLFVYYASRVWVESVPPTEDSGCMIRDVMKALACYGACLESSWPYVTKNYSVAPPASAKKAALNHQILRYYRLPNLKNIKICLSEGYPVVGGFMVPASIDDPKTAKTGVVKYPGPSENFVGGHAILFVGYDDKTQLLTFQNSWGVNWGNRGFGYLPYKFVDTWLAEDFWTIRQEEM